MVPRDKRAADVIVVVRCYQTQKDRAQQADKNRAFCDRREFVKVEIFHINQDEASYAHIVKRETYCVLRVPFHALRNTQHGTCCDN